MRLSMPCSRRTRTRYHSTLRNAEYETVKTSLRHNDAPDTADYVKAMIIGLTAHENDDHFR